MRILYLSVILGLAVCVHVSAQPPVTLVENGGFERAVRGWQLNPGCAIDDTVAHSGKLSLRVETPAGLTAASAQYDVLDFEPGATYSMSGWMRTENVQPTAATGYAYLAIYQRDGFGDLVAYRDIGHLAGTSDWTRFTYTFTMHEDAENPYIPIGLFQATGTAWFDDITLVKGEQPKEINEVTEPSPETVELQGFQPSAKGNVAVYRDAIPVVGVASSPDYLGRLLKDNGYGVAFLNTQQLADPRVLAPSAFDIVVLPYGATFPAKAAKTFVRYLRGGGDFISMGGYAFDNLLPGEPPDWQPPPPPPPEAQESSWIQDIPIENEGPRTYAFSGWLRAERVSDDGFAYLAVYQYDADGKLGPWKDVVKLHGSYAWQKAEYTFTCQPNIRRISIKVGLYRCRGVAWMDDLSVRDDEGNELLSNPGFEEQFDTDAKQPGKWYRTQPELGEIVTAQPHSGDRCAKVKLRYHLWPREVILNTARGKPRDGLDVKPDQIGAFDADFRLERVAKVRAATGQDIVPDDFRLNRKLEGWAATTVLGYDDARRVSLLATYDRYDRPRGSLGSLTYHYHGRWRGSAWAIFGATNFDLFPEGDEASAKLFLGTVGAMERGTLLHNLSPGYWCYRQGERVELSVKCSNFSRARRTAAVHFAVYEAPVGKRAEKGREASLFPEVALYGDAQETPSRRPVFEKTVELALEIGATSELSLQWQPRKFASDFYIVEAELLLDGKPVDAVRTGFAVWSPDAIKAGPQLSYHDNYCYYGDRPLVLLGSDSYSVAFNSSHEDPLVWRRDLARMRDEALNFNENLQFSAKSFSPQYEWPEELLRKVDAMIQLSGQYRQTYYAGLLVGANAITSDEELANEQKWCRAFAQRYKDVPHLMYYIDGDFRLNIIDHPDVKRRFNEFLREKYANDEALRASWRVSPPPSPLGDVPCVEYRAKSWDDMRAVDTMQFKSQMLGRWVNAHVTAIREADPDAIISSEFYSVPFGGIDIIKGVDGMDTGNIGFFTTRGHEERDLPVRLKFTDIRERGKSLSVGELGAKTHPAWKDVEGNYHEMRTREQLHDLFMTVGHYAFALGASRIHNWCWKDSVERVFPWGMSYAGDFVKKDVLDVYRAMGLLFRQFRPAYVPPSTYVLTADEHRTGASTGVVFNATVEALRRNLGAGVLNECALQSVPPTAKVIYYPLPYCPPDAVCDLLERWVRAGGRLFITGDISYDSTRRRTKTGRLERLCGVRVAADRWPERSAFGRIEVAGPLPAATFEATTAKVIGAQAGEPVLFRHELGEGEVVLLGVPIEVLKLPEGAADRWQALDRLLGGSGIEWPRTPMGPLATLDGDEVMVWGDTSQFGVEAKEGPAVAAGSKDGAIVAVEARSDLSIQGRAFLRTDVPLIAYSLDGRDVRRSKQLVLLPLGQGHVTLASSAHWQSPVWVVGEVRQGRWRAYESLPVSASSGSISIRVDQDRAFSIVLLCERSDADAAGRQVARSLTHPER